MTSLGAIVNLAAIEVGVDRALRIAAINAPFQEIRQMRKIQKFGAAMIVAAMMASGMTIFSTPVYASGDSTTTTKTTICHLLASAQTAVTGLPDSLLKSYLLKQIAAAELKYGC